MASIDDRWFTRDAAGRKVKTGRHPDNGGSPAAKRWRVRYVGADGREHSVSWKRKPDAERFKSVTEADLLRGTWTDPAAGKVTLREYARGWLAARSVEENTRERLARQLRLHVFPAFGDFPLGVLAQRPSAVQEWVSGLEMAPSSARAVLNVLSGVLSAAVDDGLIARNPCKARSVRSPRQTARKVVPWEASRVAAVRDALPARYQAMADAGAGLGLRIGETLGLSPDDIDWLRGIVHVRRQVKIVSNQRCFAPPKGGRERDVELAGSVKVRLSEHVRLHPPAVVELPWRRPAARLETARLMFTTPGGEAIWQYDFSRRIFAPARARAGVPGGRDNGFHQFRHYFASALLASGVDIRALSEYLGHHNPGFTLRIYTHLMPAAGERMRGAVDEALNPVSDGPVTAQRSRKGV